MAAAIILGLVLSLLCPGGSAIPAHNLKKHALPQSYAAIGDSYASGAGAGIPGWPPYADFRCGRYSDAYPIQVANNSLINIERTKFKHLACGGLTSAVILRDQVPYIGDSELVTLTASGNDVNFFVVLNECVYHWSPAIGCEAQIVKAREIIETSALQNLENIISGAVQHLKPGALFIVTGYARFFNERTDYCDNTTFSQTRPLDYLTKAKRRHLNQLVMMLNDVIKATALLHGAVYVDIDHAFEGHRFCEPGVKEPDLGRADTWFFNIPPPPVVLSGSQSGPPQQLLGGTETPDPETVPEWPEMRKWRVFHPTGLGHHGISQVVVEEILLRSDLEQSQ
ncbi:esterase [Cladophialophora carrionii]|uniref:Esterase n=1 Tax=Cladophialophora carrionii TaxID=86049 RepID=A0A1C1CFH7_9EURO|nr:esterase [Cladophialophora carrionii]